MEAETIKPEVIKTFKITLAEPKLLKESLRKKENMS